MRLLLFESALQFFSIPDARKLRIYKQEPPFGAKICSDICLRTLSVPTEKRTVFRERSSRKTVSFEEQIMSKDKYLSIFLKPNGGFCGYYPSNIFHNM